MKWLFCQVRVVGRLIWFAGTVAVMLIDFVRACGFRPEAAPLSARSAWLHRSTRRLLRILRVNPHVSGTVPGHGILVSNHLSYVDILVLGSLTPAVFVAKQDIRSWPVFGWLASMAGTVFIDRDRRSHVGAVNRQIENALSNGVLVVIFPEGTSSDGRGLLPFRSSLLEPAVDPNHPLSVSNIGYVLSDGQVAHEICFWGEMHFLPHLLHLLTKPKAEAYIHFRQIEGRSTDRKRLAQQLHSEVLNLKFQTPASRPALASVPAKQIS